MRSKWRATAPVPGALGCQRRRLPCPLRSRLSRTGLFPPVLRTGGLPRRETFTREAPKFQTHYVDQLVGPYPEAAAEYRARSPLHFADRLAAPVILVAGCEDRVVPSRQIENMVKKLERAGIKHMWLAFEGEGHGLRHPRNIQEALQAELSFYVDALRLG